MKKILFLLLTVIMIVSISCTKEVVNENPPVSPSIPNSAEAPNEPPKEDCEPIDEPTIEAVKPKTVEEIIEFANSLDIDTSMTGFSLDGILEEAQLQKTDDAGDDYQNTTAYLGDSVTLGLSFFKNHPTEMVIAKGSINPLDAVQKKLISLSDGTEVNFPAALKATNAKRAVLTFGSNAISIMSEETFLKYYIMLLDAIEEEYPECDIIIQSITPLATTSTFKKLTNELVNRSNLLLLTLAYSRDLKFLDTNAEMKDENGYLKLEYCSSDDGVHINELGYEVWIDMLRTHKLGE